MFRIGVVGPAPSVERIIGVTKEIEQEIELIPHPYEEVREVADIVSRHDRQVDYWLMSGFIPYQAAKKILPSDDKLVYIYSTETSIYKSFMELVYTQGELLERISIDMIPATNIGEGESLETLKNTIRQLFVKTIEAETESIELLEFHMNLWKEGKVDGVLTCYPAVRDALSREGVPVGLMSPTRIEIFHTLRIFLEKVKSSYYKDTQIGIEKIEIKDFDLLKEKMERTYQVQYLELRLKETLLQLCEKIDGTLVDEGGGRYSIFSSRGAIERELQALRDKARYLALEADTPVSVGIGFGTTVLSAEIHAHRALQKSKQDSGQPIVIIQDDGTIIESAGEQEELTYSYRTADQEVMDKLKEGTISVKSYKKVDALVQKMGWKQFTTKNLAAHLQMSERNAQRIVAELCEAGLAENIGEEAQHTRGRPVKLYRLI